MLFNIFIDSNILFKDYFLNNKSNRSILEYAKEGQIGLYISSIVIMEIRRQLQKEVQEANRGLKSVNDLNSRLNQKTVFPDLDLVLLLKSFDDFYDELSTYDSINVLYYKNDYLDDIVNRAINRIKPFTEEKTELKDALIWKTYSSYVEENNLDNCILLTNNTSDFCSKKDKSQVHPELQKDTDKFTVINQAYDFIKAWGPKIDSPGHKFTVYVSQLQIDNMFVYDKLVNEFKADINSLIKQRINTMSPHHVLDDLDYVMDGDVTAQSVEFSECDDIEVEVIGTRALISGILYVSCEVDVFQYNTLRDPSEESYEFLSENYIYYALNFNFDLLYNEQCVDFEITDYEITQIE